MTPETIGHYRVTALIGAGGMGEVYRARDTKLDRDVAIKVLPPAFASDADRMARFEREAKVLASLNHPNIAQIYGVEDRALIMELVEGESPKGPVPFDAAWKIAMQMADALEYAHDKGVVHRDLKPANVKVTPDGVVKLLDFGLAKAFSDTPESPASDAVNSPTLTMNATVAGVILGTAAYMAPEQAKGKRVDKRADIWSWGVVLYELLTGDRLFKGDDAADTLAQVLTKEPDLERVPPNVRKLLRRCLEKDPKQRLRDIGEARYLLDEPVVHAPSRPRLGIAAWVAAGAFAIATAVFAALWLRPAPPPAVVRFSFPLPTPNVSIMSVSPDGRHVAFVAVAGGKQELWVRDLDNPAPRTLADTATLTQIPFWAPDSRRLAFFDGSKLKKIDIDGGPAVTIADTGANQSDTGSWNRNDVILLAGYSAVGRPLFRVPAAGGPPAPVLEVDKARGQTGFEKPWFLPDGRHFLYIALSSAPEKGGVYVGDLASNTRKQVIPLATSAIYVNPGYLLYVRDGTLMAQPFDADKLETTADAVPVEEQVDVANIGVANLGFFSASQNGVLLYSSGSRTGNAQLTWFDRTGKKLDTAGAPGYLQWFSLSPDGTRLALTRRDSQGGNFDIWTRDLAHGSESRLTFEGDNHFPVWSADGSRIFFVRFDSRKIYQKAANGTGTEEVVDAAGRAPTDVSRDGRYLFMMTPNTTQTGSHIWVLPLFGDRKPFPYVATEFGDAWPNLSPDGRWLAYLSTESKRAEIYVVSFPQPGGKWQISTNGGIDPVWSRDGRELYYYSLDGKIMAVEIKPGAQFQFGVPKPLFAINLASTNVSFDVSKDGRFLLPVLVQQQGSSLMNVVLNWPQMLKAK
jgi:eukaryotic-like serine/threonine-protein kinase